MEAFAIGCWGFFLGLIWNWKEREFDWSSLEFWSGVIFGLAMFATGVWLGEQP